MSMNARGVTVVTGSIILVLGLAGLIYPERVMGVLGFTVPVSDRMTATLGEVRATYGGLFVVMGLFALAAAANPFANRARLLFIGLLWLGACGGRLLGVYLDGNPGLLGWLGVAFEAVIGGSLLAASQASAPVTEVAGSVPTPPVEASS